jgi:hypothetical protein
VLRSTALNGAPSGSARARASERAREREREREREIRDQPDQSRRRRGLIWVAQKWKKFLVPKRSIGSEIRPGEFPFIALGQDSGTWQVLFCSGRHLKTRTPGASFFFLAK